MTRKTLLILPVLISLQLSVACSPAPTSPTPVSPIPTPSRESKLPNPASVLCEQHGNKLEIVTADDGSQTGVCVFPDGSTCDEWAYFRGECGPAN